MRTFFIVFVRNWGKVLSCVIYCYLSFEMFIRKIIQNVFEIFALERYFSEIAITRIFF